MFFPVSALGVKNIDPPRQARKLSLGGWVGSETWAARTLSAACLLALQHQGCRGLQGLARCSSAAPVGSTLVQTKAGFEKGLVSLSKVSAPPMLIPLCAISGSE